MTDHGYFTIISSCKLLLELKLTHLPKIVSLTMNGCNEDDFRMILEIQSSQIKCPRLSIVNMFALYQLEHFWLF